MSDRGQGQGNEWNGIEIVFGARRLASTLTPTSAARALKDDAAEHAGVNARDKFLSKLILDK